MDANPTLENAFGLRWLQDDDQGRLIYRSGDSEYRSPAEAIQGLGLECDDATLKASLDRFPPHLRIHGGYAPGAGEAKIRFSLTWEPGAAEAQYSQTKDSPDEGMSGNVDVPADGSLKDVLKDLLIPDAQDVVSQAREDGKSTLMKNVDFWIGDQHFRISDEELS